MSGILSKMKAVARNRPVPMEQKDCEVCRMLAAEGTLVETIDLPDGSVVEITRMPEGWQPSPKIRRLLRAHNACGSGGAS